MLSTSELPPGLPAAAAACAWTRSASVTDLLIGSSSSAATCKCILASLQCRHTLFLNTATLLLLLDRWQRWPASFQTGQHVVSTAELSA
jgi:hypothetical protein